MLGCKFRIYKTCTGLIQCPFINVEIVYYYTKIICHSSLLNINSFLLDKSVIDVMTSIFSVTKQIFHMSQILNMLL